MRAPGAMPVPHAHHEHTDHTLHEWEEICEEAGEDLGEMVCRHCPETDTEAEECLAEVMQCGDYCQIAKAMGHFVDWRQARNEIHIMTECAKAHTHKNY